MLENSLVCTGSKTLEFAKSVNTDISFISCKGISSEGKFTDTSDEETAVRQAFMKNSRTRVMLMTENKFYTTYLHTLCSLDEVDHLFSDAEIPEEIQNKLR